MGMDGLSEGGADRLCNGRDWCTVRSATSPTFEPRRTGPVRTSNNRWTPPRSKAPRPRIPLGSLPYAAPQPPVSACYTRQMPAIRRVAGPAGAPLMLRDDADERVPVLRVPGGGPPAEQERDGRAAPALDAGDDHADPLRQRL